MLTILSAICLSILCVYFAHTFGHVFYGNPLDILFFAVLVPLLFMQSRQKIIRWVRKAHNKYFTVGRILALVCLYLILVICTSYIPAQLRTLSTLKYIEPAVKKVDALKDVQRVIVVSYGAKDSSAVAIKGKADQSAKYFVRLKKHGKEWVVSDSEKIRPEHYTFPPYR